jgi:hypothetical protein
MQSLLVWARHDSTFLPVYSQQVLKTFRDKKLPQPRGYPALRPLYFGPVPVQSD